MGRPGLLPSVDGFVSAGRSPEEVVRAVGDGLLVAGYTRSGGGDPAGRVQPLDPRRAGQGVAVGAGSRHPRLQEEPRNVLRPGRHRRAPRSLDGAAVFQLPHGTCGGEVQEVSADRLLDPGRLREGRLRIREQPSAVGLARVVLDAGRVIRANGARTPAQTTMKRERRYLLFMWIPFLTVR